MHMGPLRQHVVTSYNPSDDYKDGPAAHVVTLHFMLCAAVLVFV